MNNYAIFKNLIYDSVFSINPSTPKPGIFIFKRFRFANTLVRGYYHGMQEFRYFSLNI